MRRPNTDLRRVFQIRRFLSRGGIREQRRVATSRPGRNKTDLAPYVLIGPALVVLCGVFVAGMFVLAGFSFQLFGFGSVERQPPTLSIWRDFFGDAYQRHVIWNTVELALITTVICLAAGYPTALAIHRIRRRWLLLIVGFLLFSPLLTSVVSRTYGWSLILADNGILADALARLGIANTHFPLLYNMRGVVIAMVHILLPFMIFPIVTSLRNMSDDLYESAADLGARPHTRFLRITLPLSVSGIIGGCQLCFTLTMSALATPMLLGGGRVPVLSTGVYSDVGTLNWSRGAVASYTLLGLSLVAFALFSSLQRKVRHA